MGLKKKKKVYFVFIELFIYYPVNAISQRLTPNFIQPHKHISVSINWCIEGLKASSFLEASEVTAYDRITERVTAHTAHCFRFDLCVAALKWFLFCSRLLSVGFQLWSEHLYLQLVFQFPCFPLELQLLLWTRTAAHQTGWSSRSKCVWNWGFNRGFTHCRACRAVNVPPHSDLIFDHNFQDSYEHRKYSAPTVLTGNQGLVSLASPSVTNKSQTTHFRRGQKLKGLTLQMLRYLRTQEMFMLTEK